MGDNRWIRAADGSMIRPEFAAGFDVERVAVPASMIALRVHVVGERSRENSSTTRPLHLAEVSSEFEGSRLFDNYDEDIGKRNAQLTERLTSYIPALTTAIAGNSSSAGDHIVFSVDSAQGVLVERRNMWTNEESTERMESD